MDETELKAQIAKVDEMLDRVDALARKAKPIKPDLSLPRYVPPPPKPVETMPPPSFDPQQRFDEIRRERRKNLSRDTGYRPICTGSFGSDVDAAFEACSNAPT